MGPRELNKQISKQINKPVRQVSWSCTTSEGNSFEAVERPLSWTYCLAPPSQFSWGGKNEDICLGSVLKV